MDKLIRRIQNGENELLEKVVIDNLDYIYSFTEKYKNSFKDYEDLKQEMIKEFIQAIYAYKFTNDFLMKYAKRRLFSRVRRYVTANFNQLVDADEKYAVCVKAYDSCEQKLGYKPNFYELSRYLCVPKSAAYKIIDFINDPIENYNISFNEIVIDMDEDRVLQNIEREEFKDLIIKASFTKREKELLLFYYGFYNGEVYDFSDMSRKLDSYRQVYSSTNKNLIKKIYKRISE